MCKLKYENILCKHVLRLEARLDLLYSACFWITFFFFVLVIDTHVAVSFDKKNLNVLKMLAFVLGLKESGFSKPESTTGINSVCMSCNWSNDFATTLQGVLRLWSPLQMTGFC